MRTLLTLGVLGLALGLAAQMLPRSLGGDASASAARRVDQTPSANWPGYSPRTPAARASAAFKQGAAHAYEPAAEWADESATDDGEIAAPTPIVGADADETRAPVERLSASGFSRDRIAEIQGRESRVRLDAAWAEYRATGAIGALNPRPAPSEQVRAEIGDADYEPYLRATGQPTRVIVGDVESASAAAYAGIMAGDEILRYAGRRVFNLRDLHALMLRTSASDIVAATIVRNGQPLQLYVTGGPLGLLHPENR